MQHKNSFIMIIFFLAAQFVAAQETYVIYEGTQLNYKVDFNEGNSYTWGMVNGSNTIEFDYLTDPNFSDVLIKWNQAGLYYLTVTETDAGGCSNKKGLAVQVQPNNRSIGFDLLSSNECFNPEGNGFEQKVILLDHNDMPLAANYFPLTVFFNVNGVDNSQVLDYNNQLIQVMDDQFIANPLLNTNVELKITGVTDKYKAPITLRTSRRNHVRTIFAIPEIEFTEELRTKYLLNETITAYTDTGNFGHNKQLESNPVNTGSN